MKKNERETTFLITWRALAVIKRRKGLPAPTLGEALRELRASFCKCDDSNALGQVL